MVTGATLIPLAIVSSILYRLGGASKLDAKKEFPWVADWFVNLPKKRDIGCGLCCLIYMLKFNVPWWVHLVSLLLLWGALSTYWDWLFNDVDNFFMHGLGCAFAYSGYAIYTKDYSGFGFRCLALAVSMGVLCNVFKKPIVEEMGRGSLLVLTLALL